MSPGALVHDVSNGGLGDTEQVRELTVWDAISHGPDGPDVVRVEPRVRDQLAVDDALPLLTDGRALGNARARRSDDPRPRSRRGALSLAWIDVVDLQVVRRPAPLAGLIGEPLNSGMNCRLVLTTDSLRSALRAQWSGVSVKAGQLQSADEALR